MEDVEALSSTPIAEAVHVGQSDDIMSLQSKLPTAIMKARERRGECPKCGVRTHKLRFLRRRVPLTVPGVVFRGRCELCNPPVAAATFTAFHSSSSTMESPLTTAFEEEDSQSAGGIESFSSLFGPQQLPSMEEEGPLRRVRSERLPPTSPFSLVRNTVGVLGNVPRRCDSQRFDDVSPPETQNSGLRRPNVHTRSRSVGSLIHVPAVQASSPSTVPVPSSPASAFDTSSSSSRFFFDRSPVHVSSHQVRCASCGTFPIIGARYKCLHCPGVDFCSEGCAAFHPRSHLLLLLGYRCVPLEGLVHPLPLPDENEDDELIEGTLIDQDSVVHTGVSCDSCQICPIVGVRYRDLLRTDRDYCRACLIQDATQTGNNAAFDASVEARRNSGGPLASLALSPRLPAVVVIRAPLSSPLMAFSPEIIAAAASSPLSSMTFFDSPRSTGTTRPIPSDEIALAVAALPSPSSTQSSLPTTPSETTTPDDSDDISEYHLEDDEDIQETQQHLDVHVRTWYGRTISLYGMEPDDTIRNLKVRIELKSEVPADRQCLFFGGHKALRDEKTLEECEIRAGSTLNLTPCL